MYQPIIISDHIITKIFGKNFMESTLKEFQSIYENHDQLYTEAVFAGGKESVKKIEDSYSKIKNILMNAISVQDRTNSENKSDPTKKKLRFSPTDFWKHKEFKELENSLKDAFGFRSVNIIPYRERWSSEKQEFESKEFNAFAALENRFPIDGLVTDKGFYDTTHSINLYIILTLGVIKALSPGELVAVTLHEIGHNIDPALVNIQYAETNIISKYLTDRKGNLNAAEKKVEKTNGKFNLLTALSSVVAAVTNNVKSLFIVLPVLFVNKNKLLKKIQAEVEKDVKAGPFNRKEYSEAFADNFARMYGYGPQLTSALHKFDKNTESILNSRIKKEKARQKAITAMIIASLKDEHKTDVHRTKALIAEYHKDINDPNIPDKVKAQLKEDVAEVEKVLKKYLNDFSEFQNSAYAIINDEINKADVAADKEKPDATVQDKEPEKKEDVKKLTESATYLESRKAYEKLIKAKESITPLERADIKRKFGKTACSFGKDKDGYYCFTHRARSKSYKTINEIPQKDVDFINSTS